MNFLLELGDIMLYKSTIFVRLKGRKYFRDLGGDILYYDKIVPDLTIENFPLVFVDSKNLKKKLHLLDAIRVKLLGQKMYQFYYLVFSRSLLTLMH